VHTLFVAESKSIGFRKARSFVLGGINPPLWCGFRHTKANQNQRFGFQNKVKKVFFPLPFLKKGAAHDL